MMMTAFFLGLSFAALTSMISTVELCVRNFVDHGIERNKAVGFTACAIFLLGLPSTFVWIHLDAEGVAFPEFLEVQEFPLSDEVRIVPESPTATKVLFP